MSRTVQKIQRLSGDYYADLFDKEVVSVRVYDKDNLLVGRKRNGRLQFLDLSDGVRLLVLGMVGSGKSFFIRGLVDRLHRSGGYHIAFLPDVKNEYVSSINEVQEKFWKNNHAPHETPAVLPIKSFKPLFFEKYGIKIPSSSKGFGFDFKSITFSDFKEIVSFDDLPDLQKIAVEELFENMDEGSLDSLEDLESEIDGSTILQSNSKTSLKAKLRRIYTKKFVCEPVVNPVDVLLDGGIPALNLERFSDVDKSGGFVGASVSIWRRQLVNAKIEGVLKKRLFIIMDESSRFVPKLRSTSVKFDVEEGIELERRYFVNYLFAYQSIVDVPDKVLENCRYVLLPYNAGADMIIEVFKSANIDKGSAQTRRQRYADLFRELKRVPFSWLVIDRNTGRFDVVKFFSPMSYHMTSSG